MYVLTEAGKQELDLYSDADVDDLRLTRRTLMIPVLEAIDAGHTTASALRDTTGFDRYELSGALGNLCRRGMVTRMAPGPDAPQSEKTAWIQHLYVKSHPQKVVETKERGRARTVRSMERYPEIAQAEYGKLRLRGHRQRIDRYGGYGTYMEELGRRKEEGRLWDSHVQDVEE